MKCLCGAEVDVSPNIHVIVSYYILLRVANNQHVKGIASKSQKPMQERQITSKRITSRQEMSKYKVKEAFLYPHGLFVVVVVDISLCWFF